MGRTTKKTGEAKGKAPVAAAKPARKIAGRTLGLNVRETWVHLLQENAKRKLTDAKLSAFMRSEFPDRKSKEITTVEGIRPVRAGYNRGVFTGGKGPAVRSVAYDTNGKVIEARRRSAIKTAK